MINIILPLAKKLFYRFWMLFIEIENSYLGDKLSKWDLELVRGIWKVYVKSDEGISRLIQWTQ